MGFIYDLFDDFISLLFPRLCNGCGEPLMKNEKLICTNCYIAIPRSNFHLETDNVVEKIFWGRCKLERAAAFSIYNRDSRIRKLIHNMKYRGVKEIGYEMGRIYGNDLVKSDFIKGIDLIIPVPLHPYKERKRGFNQSMEIAKGLSVATGIPIEPETLVRTPAKQTQTKLTRIERWSNVEGIFRVTNPEKIANKHLLLVDDVITTGATIESCAAELLKSENTRVSVVALATTIN